MASQGFLAAGLRSRNNRPRNTSRRVNRSPFEDSGRMMMARAIEDFESAQESKEHDFEIGDTVDVYVRIVEGEKERVQIFNGTVIARKKAG